MLENKIFEGKQVILFSTGPDILIETLWWQRHQRRLFESIAKMGFVGVTGMNFSVISGECPFGHALNIKKSVCYCEELEKLGVWTIPHIYAINDYQREPEGASTVWREALELEEDGKLKMAKNAAGPEAGAPQQARGACKALKIKGRQALSSVVKPQILKNNLRSQKAEFRSRKFEERGAQHGQAAALPDQDGVQKYEERPMKTKKLNQIKPNKTMRGVERWARDGQVPSLIMKYH